MTGGGDDAPPPPPPVDPREEMAAQMEFERQMAELRRQEAARAAAEQERLEAERRAGRAAAIDTGRGEAASRISGRLESEYGVDPSLYTADIDRSLEDLIAGIPTGATGEDVPTFFRGDLTAPLVTSIEDRNRRAATRGLDAFAAPGFTKDLYTGTEDDAIIDAIIADQFGTATDTLTRAFDRGTLDQAGLDTALAKLGEQRTAAGSRLQELGGGLLEQFRQGARDRVGTARDRIGTLSIGQTFDPASVEQAILGDRETNLAGLEGGLRRTIGGEPLFDTSDLIQRGAVSQGLINPVRGNVATGTGGQLLNALARRREDEDRERGLGTQGVI